MKRIVRKIVRYILGVKEFETIADALVRIKYNLIRKFNHTSFSANDIDDSLRSLGLSRGDIVIFHCSWRALIGYSGTPRQLLDCILSIIGKEGTLLMPSYTHNRDFFNYYDPSSAGFISEYFRSNYPVKRSLNNVFSMVAIGKYADEFTKDHINSIYYFDENSPYYKSIKNNAKILLLGLGKNPHKISLFHCISYELRNKLKFYNNVYTLQKKGIIIDKDNQKHEVIYYDRQPKYQNNKRNFRNLFQNFIKKENYIKINKTDIYLFDSRDMYDAAKKYMLNENYKIYNIYKN